MTSLRPCRECGRPILLVKNGNTGHYQPLDPSGVLDGDGNVALTGPRDNEVAMVLSKAELATERGRGLHRYLYTAHQATCPARHRKTCAA